MPSRKPFARVYASFTFCAAPRHTNSTGARNQGSTGRGCLCGEPARMDDALRRYLAGEIPGHLALMQMFIASDTESGARTELLSAISSANEECAERLMELTALWDRAPNAYSLVSQIHAMANTEGCESGRGRVSDFREVFDRAAGISAEAGVALYSLGDRELLQSITTEVVVLMQRYQLFNSDSVVAEI